MLYCTYQEYSNSGGTVPQAAFDVLCRRASALVDSITWGRAAAHAECSTCHAALADACGQIIDLLAARTAVTGVPGAQSISNDGYSVTFAAGSRSAALRAEAAALLQAALGADPHGLLYRGCC